jgi:hypothetical protein
MFDLHDAFRGLSAPDVMTGQKREARLRADVPAPTSLPIMTLKTWMPGTRPGMTIIDGHFMHVVPGHA